MNRFVFVTGGVVSSLGKGIAAASLGAILEARGLKATMLKLDPYINVDPGTMSPFQHGEVFVTDDGAETDLDLELHRSKGSEIAPKQPKVSLSGQPGSKMIPKWNPKSIQNANHEKVRIELSPARELQNRCWRGSGNWQFWHSDSIASSKVHF